ncbi:hypothetical protein D3C73_1229290 [compost metagenome]
MNSPDTTIALPMVIPLIGMIYWGVGLMICRPSIKPIISSSEAAIDTAILQTSPLRPRPLLAAFHEATPIIMKITIRI